MDFRKGDKVWDEMYGKGFVKKEEDKLIYVEFEDYGKPSLLSYLKDGRKYSDARRSLFHGHNVRIEGEEVPERLKQVVLREGQFNFIAGMGAICIYLPEDLADALEEWIENV